MQARKQHNADLLIVLLLFFIYAGSALLLCVLGANSYSQTVAVLQEGYDQRTGALYITQKVRQGDIGGGVRVEQYGQDDALVLTEQQTGEGYETWLFIEDGYLCELFTAAGSEVNADQAQRIMPMQKMLLSFTGDNLLDISLTTETGTHNTVRLLVRSDGSPYNTGSSPPPSSSVGGGSESEEPPIMTPAPNEGGAG